MSATSLPPHDVNSERALLGAALVNPECIPSVALIVQAQDFFIVCHRWIWEVLLGMIKTGSAIDIVTVSAMLEQISRLAEIGGLGYLIGLIAETPSSLHAETYARLVHDYAIRRRAIETASMIAREAYGGATLASLRSHAALITELPENDSRIVWTACQLCNSDLGGAEWLVDGLLLSGGVNLIAGEPAAGKSFLTPDLALGITQTGTAWHDFQVSRGRGLYYYLDGSPRGMKTRLERLCAGKNTTPPNDLLIDFSPLDLRQPSASATLRQTIKKSGISVVIFDVLARFMPGADENAVSDVAPVMGTLRDVATKTNTTIIIIIHHLNKGVGAALWSRIRGSSDILSAVDTALIVAYGENRHNSPRRVIPEKNREGELIQPFAFQIHATDGQLRLMFESTDPGEMKTITTKRSATLQQLLKTLASNPNISFTRQDLINTLSPQAEISERTAARVFSVITEYANIQIGKSGNQTTYRWIEG
ncbi:MAG TPA: AAA family ATPase [Anaerolineaceae bacterium]|nr:AAA family ATPase [Anaerolineaceae bacterium]HQH85542.1 AAA family ATPase [Anaerolineaceae bacterium]